eukprot:11817536-Karenia_brevis.AAC.1
MLGRYVRGSLIQHVYNILLSTQYGSGFNGGEPAVAHLHAHALLHVGRVMRLSTFLIFIDIVSAFSSLVRYIVFDIDKNDERWLLQLKSAGFTDDEIRSIYVVCTECAFSSECNSVAYALAARLYQSTWFSTEGLPQVVNTSLGSGAGLPMADL